MALFRKKKNTEKDPIEQRLDRKAEEIKRYLKNDSARRHNMRTEIGRAYECVRDAQKTIKGVL